MAAEIAWATAVREPSLPQGSCHPSARARSRTSQSERGDRLGHAPRFAGDHRTATQTKRRGETWEESEVDARQYQEQGSLCSRSSSSSSCCTSSPRIPHENLTTTRQSTSEGPVRLQPISRQTPLDGACCSRRRSGATTSLGRTSSIQARPLSPIPSLPSFSSGVATSKPTSTARCTGLWWAMRLLFILCSPTLVNAAIHSGDQVYLIAHTGDRLAVDDTKIYSRWDGDQSLQQFTMETNHSGPIRPGDIIFLKTYFGTYVDVNDTVVEAVWHDRGRWQALIIEKSQQSYASSIVFGGHTSIENGDKVFFRAHTGMYIEVEGSQVQARWPDQGDWQGFHVHDIDEAQGSSDLFHGALDILGAGCGFPKADRAIQCGEFMETDCTSSKSLVQACPRHCPYAAPHPQLSCVFECTTAEDCSAANPETAFPNNQTMVCEECEIVGCRRCSSKTICEECFDNFWLEFGGHACMYVWDERAQHGVHALAALVLALLLLASVCVVVVDHCACCGRLLPVESPDDERSPAAAAEDLLPDEVGLLPSLEELPIAKAIRQGKLHRSRCRIRGLEPVEVDVGKQGEVPVHYSSLPLWTNFQAEFLTGVGMPLFHQWYKFLFFYSLLLTAGTFMVYRYSELGGVIQKTGIAHATNALNGDDAMALCGLRARNHDQLGDSMTAFARRAAQGYFLLWVAGFFLSVCHAIRQKNIASSFYKSHPCLAEFAINVEGFPPDATDEIAIRNFLREVFSTEALEVSVCYDYRCRRMRVHDLLEKCLVQEDVRVGAYESCLAPDENQNGRIGLSEQERAEVRSWFDPKTTDGLKNAGHVFAIFPHTYDLRRCRERLEESLKSSATSPPSWPHQFTPRWLRPEAPMPRWIDSKGQLHDLTLRDVMCEPPDIVWENLGTETWRRIVGHFVAMVMIMGSFLGMAIGLFVPLATYTINYMTQAGAVPTGVMMTVLGTLVMAANWVMCFVHSKASAVIGFDRRDREGLLLFKVFAALCLVNFCFNMCIALFPESKANVWQYILNPLGSGMVSMQGVAFDTRVAGHLFHVLVPGGLFIGYLIWPLQGFLWPFVSALATLRCCYRRARVASARVAEVALEPLGVSLAHDYMGTIVQPISCSLVLFFASDVAWQTFACLIGWSLFMVVFMRYLHLREVRRCYCTTNRLDTDVLLSWGIPLNMVLAASSFWLMKLLHWHIWFVPLAWAAGMVLYVFVLVTIVRPLIPPKSEGGCHRPGYDEVKAQRHYNWHNCNPIKVLLSHCYCDSPEGPIAPFQTGKEYLHTGQRKRRRASTWAVREGSKPQARTSRFIPDFTPEIEELINGPLEAFQAFQSRRRTSTQPQLPMTPSSTAGNNGGGILGEPRMQSTFSTGSASSCLHSKGSDGFHDGSASGVPCAVRSAPAAALPTLRVDEDPERCPFDEMKEPLNPEAQVLEPLVAGMSPPMSPGAPPATGHPMFLIDTVDQGDGGWPEEIGVRGIPLDEAGEFLPL